MAKGYFYSSTADTDLAKELLAGCGEIYIQKHEYSGTAVLNLNGAGDDFLLLDDDDAAANDDYNSSAADNLYIVDDNGKLAVGKVKDTFADTGGTEISFDSTAMKLVSDGVTGPTLTDGGSYTVLVLSGSNTNAYGDYMGYMDDSVEWDTAIETEPLEVCNIEGAMVEIAENATKRSNTLSGSTYNVPNTDVLSKIMNMVAYGQNTAARKEYHGGSAPNISNYYQMTILTKDWDDKYIAIQLFKGQLMADGSLTVTGKGWKTVKWTFKGKRDAMRDSYSTDMFRFIRY